MSASALRDLGLIHTEVGAHGQQFLVDLVARFAPRVAICAALLLQEEASTRSCVLTGLRRARTGPACGEGLYATRESRH